MIAKVYEVEWELSKKIVALLPQSSITYIKNRTVNQVRLVPLVTAKLRLGEILVIEIKNQALLLESKMIDLVLFYFILILF